jgi:hypothetical protein
MANPNKANGTTWETVVTNYLNECGLGARRTGSAEAAHGDIHSGEWTHEAKAEKSIDLPGYLKQIAAAVAAAGRAPWKSAVWVKNRRHGVKDAYVVMSGENYRALMIYVSSMEGTLEHVTRTFLEGGNG